MVTGKFDSFVDRCGSIIVGKVTYRASAMDNFNCNGKSELAADASRNTGVESYLRILV